MKLLKALLVIAVFAFVGCGSEDAYDPRENSGSSLEIDYSVTESSREFTIKHDLPGSYIDMVNRWWVEVEECTQLHTDLGAFALHIHYVNVDSFFVVINDKTLEVVGSIWVDWQVSQVVIKDLINTTGFVTKHEMMHYILERNGLNRGHDNPMFSQCRYIMQR